MDKDFDAEKFYDGCLGVMHTKDPKQRVLIKAYGGARNYMETLPFHESQKIVSSDGESTVFEMNVKVTNDFLQLVMMQGDMIEVLEPASVREQMKNFAKSLMKYYDK